MPISLTQNLSAQNLPVALALIIALSSICLPSYAQDKWKIDPRYSRADFTIAHMVVSTLHGTFSKVDGNVNFDGKDLNHACVLAKIDMASVDTGIGARDDHLRNADFFNVAKYPTMSFQSKRVEALKNGKFKIVGTLTLKGISKEVTLDADSLQNKSLANAGQVLLTKATTEINRKDFGITYNALLDNGGTMIGDKVDITLNIALTKSMPPLAMDGEQTDKN